MPALALPPTAVAIAFAALPFHIADCVARVLTRSYRDTRDLCPDVLFARVGDTGTSTASAPRTVNQVDIFVDVTVEGDRFFVVPRVPAQRPVATFALLLVVLTAALTVVVVVRSARHPAVPDGPAPPPPPPTGPPIPPAPPPPPASGPPPGGPAAADEQPGLAGPRPPEDEDA